MNLKLRKLNRLVFYDKKKIKFMFYYDILCYQIEEEKEKERTSVLSTEHTEDEINVELMEVPEKDLPSDDDETNFQQALNEDIDHASLHDDMHFECVCLNFLKFNFNIKSFHFLIVSSSICVLGGLQIVCQKCFFYR